jgi:aspartate/methionine/tyrosine aminotransferase
MTDDEEPSRMTLTQLGITPVPLSCLPPSFLPSIDTCRALITPKTRAIVLVTPNNPTGAIISPTLLAEFGALAVEMGVALVLDETYRELLDDRPHDLFTTGEPSWRKYLIHLFSFSK